MKNIIFVLFLFAVSACANNTSQEKTSRSSVNKGTDTAVVKISIDKKGMPYVDVDPVIIKEGQRIVWVGPTEMQVIIQEGDVLSEEDLATKDAVINLKTHVLDEKLWDEKERVKKFKYDVVVKGVVLDPVIILRRSF